MYKYNRTIPYVPEFPPEEKHKMWSAEICPLQAPG